MKVIILTDSKFTKQHYKDLHIRQISEEFPVEIWDISYFMFDEKLDVDNSFDVKRIVSPQEFDERLRTEVLSGKCVIVSKPCPESYKRIYPHIKKAGLELICLDKDVTNGYWEHRATADFGYKQSLMRSLRSKLYINDKTRYLIMRMIKRIPPYDYLLTPKAVYPEVSNIIVPMHHIKYDEYCSDPCEDIVGEKYALFVDTAAVNHPMYKGIFTNNEIGQYFELLNRYFSIFEDKYGIPVIIAGYPKIENVEGIFGNRRVIYYKTSQLIRNCDVVLTHYTTSIITALFADKPLVLLRSRLLENCRRNVIRKGQYLVQEYTRLLEVPCDILEDGHVSDYSINMQKYTDFKNEYLIKQELKDYSNGQIINDFLHKYEDSYSL